MAKFSTAAVFLVFVIANCYYSNALQQHLHSVNGIQSVKTWQTTLQLPATSVFRPINSLKTSIYLSKPASVFVHYQFTFYSSGHFYSKLLINHANAGSLVHSGVQGFKTAIGFYMANLNRGRYTFEIHYKSTGAINTPNHDWQTALLQVMWFDNAHSVSDGIKCYPTPTATNTYNRWGPLRDIEAVLRITSNRAAISAYQLSVDARSANHFLTALNVNGFHQQPTQLIKGNAHFLDLSGAWAGNVRPGLHYFGMQYRTPVSLSFTDCKELYNNNKNLYAMMLPPSCRATTVNPKGMM